MLNFRNHLFLIFLLLISSCSIIGNIDISKEDIINKYANKNDGSKFLNINNSAVHYRDEGSGPVIIAIHGVCDSLHTWDSWAKELTSNYRLVRLDLPGFGITGGIKNGEYSRELYIDYIDKFVNKLNIKKFHLVGNSLGGYVSWTYSVNYPDKVKSLTLIDPAAYPQDPPIVFKLGEYDFLSEIFQVFAPRPSVKYLVKQVFSDSSKIKEEDIDRFHQIMLMDGNRLSYSQVFKSIAPMVNLYPKDISKITVPTLLMWGEDDQWIPYSHTKLWQKDHKNLKLVTLKGVGHVAQMEAPIKSVKEFLEFISNK